MLYYLVIFVDSDINYQECFEADDPVLAEKYIVYKEQAVRELSNWNKSEKDRSIITSKHYTSENVIKIDSEIVSTIESVLQNIAKLRGLLIDSFHKLK